MKKDDGDQERSEAAATLALRIFTNMLSRLFSFSTTIIYLLGSLVYS
jgi:hypothetical protein